jgi:hypothetical protein
MNPSGDNIIPIVAVLQMKQSLSGLSAFFKTTEAYVTELIQLEQLYLEIIPVVRLT